MAGESIPPRFSGGFSGTIDTIGPIATAGGRAVPWGPGAATGLIVTFGLHAVLALALTGLHALPHTSMADRLAERLEEAPPEPRAITAKLVKLGRSLDRRRLPDRVTKQVRALAPDQAVGTPADIAIARSGKAPQKALEKAPAKQATAEDLAKTLERAKILAQVGDTRSTEGSPEGVRDGEVGPDEARPLDLYVTLLHRLIRSRWNTDHIPAEELAGLRCVVSFQVNRDLTIGAGRLVTPSGNSGFDASALEALQRFRNEVGTVPPPPDEEVAEAIFTRPVTIRFRKVVQ